MPDTYWLVLLDTDRIHEFVFGTNKLKEIRGASKLVHDFNYHSIMEILKKNNMKGNAEIVTEKFYINPQKTIAKDKIDWQILFLGGGSGKILFKDKNAALTFIQTVESEYYKKTIGAGSITCEVVKFNDNEKSQFSDGIRNGEDALHRKKQNHFQSLEKLNSPYFQFCSSSSILHAQVKAEHTPYYISKICNIKRELGQTNSNEKRLINAFNIEDNNKLLAQYPNYTPAESLTVLGEFSSGYIGLIYADANRMSEKLKNCKSAKEFLQLSEKVRNAIIIALEKSIEQTVTKNNKKVFPVIDLLIGGDDVIIAVPADIAINFAIKFCDEFSKASEISICAGVLITHANYPIFKMLSHAESLLKNAKRASFQSENNENFIDYWVLKGQFADDINEFRKNDLKYQSAGLSQSKNLELYKRPYSTSVLLQIIKLIPEFKKASFPKNKLKEMYKSLFSGYDQSILDYYLAKMRIPKDKRDLLQKFWEIVNIPEHGKDQQYSEPWMNKKSNIDFHSPLPDFIELYDFIGENK